jgi:glycosyltransferase involved in cell wall biosynthesis
LRITLLSTTDYLGGACRSAYRLHDGLRRLGCQSQLYVGTKVRSDVDVKCYQPTMDFPVRVSRILRQVKLEHELKTCAHSVPIERTFYADDRTRWGADPLKQIPQADVIHLHWVAGFLDYPSFFPWLPKAMPLVWTLHDMANFTGGCCHDLGCRKFMQQCGACPQFGSTDTKDLTRRVWLRKRDHYAALDPAFVRVVTPSAWLAREVGRSPLLSRFNCSVIPYGVDIDTFQPRQRHASRDLLGVPGDATVVLFVADNPAEYVKGFPVLAHALSALGSERQIFLLCLGRGSWADLAGFPHAHFEDITNDRMLSFVYSAADLFVLPSLADNLPNTVLESIACGTPVVGFDVGGVPEMVRPGVTGLLANAGDAGDLKDAMSRLLQDPSKHAELAANCRRIALAEYDSAIQAKRYISIYEELRPDLRG